MIAIINRSRKSSGECEYELKINEVSIAHFKHIREDGLSTCLRKAADAVEQARAEDLMRMVVALNKSDD